MESKAAAKCPHCDFRSNDREEQIKHLIEKHLIKVKVVLSDFKMNFNSDNYRFAANEIASKHFK
jgi:hypothetical protein